MTVPVPEQPLVSVVTPVHNGAEYLVSASRASSTRRTKIGST
jgi:hypothetical protein